MTERDDIDGLAGEYVLGTLDAAERTAVSARRLREPQLDAAIANWERRLAPLINAVPAVEPPPAILARIHAQLSPTSMTNAPGVAPRTADVVALTRGVRFWRTATLASSLVAAALVGFIGVRELTPKPPTKNLVAVLQKDAQSPAFLVTVNIDQRLMTVRPVAAQHEAGKSFELWIVHDKLGGPKSLGVIDDPKVMRKPTLAAYQPNIIEEATYAVSLEPEGGSTTGGPTGPVVFAGKLIATGE